ncbi:MAG: rhodanese-like domain-containing protein [Anaerolineae bacterium]|nr:rhodanese-like domain-containing protein [Anaerolineae bacterium]
MILERITSQGLAHYSYLVGDETAGVCAVIDARRDVEVYLERARHHQVEITHILETHIHADYVSGSRELAARCGAPIYTGVTAEVAFEHRPLQDGQEIELGEFTLRTLHAPGHTPEHIVFLIRGGAGASAPWGLFSGDTLFAGDVGRPDLLGEEQEEELADKLYTSLHEKLLPLGDGIIIYPAHGEGSPCGASIGARPSSTLGYERANNELLQITDRETFVRQVLAAQSAAPSYYARMKKVNARGPEILGALPALPALDAATFMAEMQRPNSIVLDLRSLEAFAGAHIEGALNIGMREPFPIWAGRILEETLPIWAGWIVAPDSRILLVADSAEQAAEARTELLRVGYEQIGGYLRRGLHGWTEQGMPVVHSELLSVQELRAIQEAGEGEKGWQILDVRSEQEWNQGHIPGAVHIPVHELDERLGELDRNRPLAVYCGSGYRASIAASLLMRNGFEKVANVPGSISGWKGAGYPLEGD